MKRQISSRNISSSYEKLLEPTLKNRVSVGMGETIKEYFQIDVEAIVPYKNQARKIFDEESIRNLSETIKLHGVRQPLTVIKSQQIGLYEVISGERRLKAAKMAGLQKVPCIVLQSNENIEEIALIENIQREDLHPIELSDCYSSLLSDYKYGDIVSLSKRLAISNSHVAEVLSYQKFPNEIKEYLLQHNIRARTILRSLKACKSLESMKNYLGIAGREKKLNKQKSLVQILLLGNEISVKVGKWRLTKEEKSKLKEKLKHFLETI